MKLSTNKVAFLLEFDNGDTAKIFINPNDHAIIEKIKAFEKKVEERTKTIDIQKHMSDFNDDLSQINFENPEVLFSLSRDTLDTLQKRAEAVADVEFQYNDIIKSELDEVFNSNISEAAFKYCRPLDVVVYVDDNGEEKREIYIMQFLKWLATELNNYGKANKAAMEKHIAKYKE